MPTLREIFSNTADAIRTKTGRSDLISPPNFPTEIDGINSDIPVEYTKINVVENVQLNYYGESLVYGEQNTAHYVGVNSFDLTTYNDYSNYLSYDATTSKFTVLADFIGFFRCWVENYQSSATAPRGKLFYNDTEVLNWEANETYQGATGGNSTEINCRAGDNFFVTTPTDRGWAKQYIKVYKEDN